MRVLRRYERCIITFVLISFLLGMIFSIHLLTRQDDQYTHSAHIQKLEALNPARVRQNADSAVDTSDVLYGEINSRPKLGHPNHLVRPRHDPDPPKPVEDSLDPLRPPEDYVDPDEDSVDLDQYPPPSYNVHAFYYIWYGNPTHDGEYRHWNHPYIRHWNPKVADKWPSGRHEPPDDIGASFYPALGPYSSRDPGVMAEHMKQLRTAGIGTISVSWYPPKMSDENGSSIDHVISPLLDVAQKYKVKVCFHIEPYSGRDAASLRENLKYILSNYGKHPAFYKYIHGDHELPLYYIYDSYREGREEWSKLLTDSGSLSVRGTQLDGIFIGLLVEARHRGEISRGGFDGFYTYFASNGFSYGSSTQHWPSLAREATSKRLLFIPSVGPGYMDERVRPWNAINTKERRDGDYYTEMLQAALVVKPPILSITSFNEWHEGTQIETAIPKHITGYKYLDYTPHDPDYYLTLTRQSTLKYKGKRKA